ncbi:MAG: alpha-beta hydrolase superfamily lysophospholipase [Myxococcota bacterium]
MRGIVHIAHGMGEHGGRYARLAEVLTGSGLAVYANDHRGHGRTASEADLGFFAEQDGWQVVLDDLRSHIDRERAEHPGVPLILMGHSMGSFMAQQSMVDHAEVLDAVILSGTNGRPPFIARLGRLLARMEKLRQGARGKSPIIAAMSFDDFNKKFRPNRTDFDWLSRDEAEVDRYIADPRCGFRCTNQLWIDLLDALDVFTTSAFQARMPPSLPVYLLAGTRDPVGDNGKSVQSLAEALSTAGLTDVTLKLYEEGRHESFNEINRDVVMGDLLAWIQGVLSR